MSRGENIASHAFVLETAQLRRVSDAVESLPETTQLGPYRLQEPLGAGGMGVVYLAEQESPIKRTVALKLIKPGMDSREIISRFQSERQALATMNHRNVAKVLDAGTSDDGRPYFVMEYVPGKSITSYCDEHRYTIKRRLELFIQACEAVQHAHQKAIIHRDIKPSNILVTGENGDAEVKVIDFGVAKALSPTLEQQQTLYTQSGQLIGTPDYMSPEQAGSDGHGVDTRSDIYSLGVVLYELLTGALPFDPKTLRSSGVAEIQRIIREVDPPRPSTRLSTLGETASEIASNRAMRLDTLHRELRDELEWIPLKAMRKEPDRRYTSAQQLAEDIRNYLDKKPLLAGPESRIYRIKKFLHRNRTGVAASATMVLLLTAGVTFYIHRIRAEQAKTLAALNDAETANQTLEAVNDFLTRDVIGAAEPAMTRGREITLREAVDNAAKDISKHLGDHPVVEAKVRLTVALAYQSLGKTAAGLEHTRIARKIYAKELGEEHPQTLACMSAEGLLLNDLGRYVEAEGLLRDLLEKHQRVLGDDDRNTLSTIGNLAGALKGLGKLEDARQYNEEALDRARRLFGPEDDDTILYTNNLAHLLWMQTRYADAEPLFRENLAQSRRLRGDDHPLTLMAVMNLGSDLMLQGKLDDAEPLLREAVDGLRKVNGDDHPNTIGALLNLGYLLLERQNADAAEVVINEAVQLATRTLDDDHPVRRWAEDLLKKVRQSKASRVRPDAPAPGRK